MHFFQFSPVSIRWRTALWIIFNFFYYPSGTNEEGSSSVVTVTVAGLPASRYSLGKRFFLSFNIYSEEFYFLADATTGDLSHA